MLVTAASHVDCLAELRDLLIRRFENNAFNVWLLLCYTYGTFKVDKISQNGAVKNSRKKSTRWTSYLDKAIDLNDFYI